MTYSYACDGTPVSNPRSLNQITIIVMAMRRAIARRAKAIAIPLAITPLTPSVVLVIFVSPLMVVLLSFLVLSVSSLFFLSVFLLLLLSISLPLLAPSLILLRAFLAS